MNEKDYAEVLYKLGYITGCLKRTAPDENTEIILVKLHEIREIVDKAREEKIRFDADFG